jgi:aspartyl aminopeptidase
MSTISKSADVSALLKFLDLSPSPFHAVDQARQMLESAGFQRLVESLTWKLIPNGKYFFTRNGSSLVAFTVGGQFVCKVVEYLL